jgi:hypothetical protein
LDYDPHGPTDPDKALERGEKTRIVGLIDMVLIPEPGLSNLLSIALMAQPARRGWINSGLAVIAQQRNRIPLDIAPHAGRPRLIVDGDPHERHASDDVATRTSSAASAARTLWSALLPCPQVGHVAVSSEFSAVPTMSLKIDPR